jgi:hypothetical protein
VLSYLCRGFAIGRFSVQGAVSNDTYFQKLIIVKHAAGHNQGKVKKKLRRNNKISDLLRKILYRFLLIDVWVFTVLASQSRLVGVCMEGFPRNMQQWTWATVAL